MTEEDYVRLRNDIKENGQRVPIVVTETGMILDGRHRYRACSELGLKPPTVTYDGDDPAGYVLSLNLARRHLTAEQRAFFARSALEAAGEPVTHERVAKAAKVSKATARRVASKKTAPRVVHDEEPEEDRTIEAGPRMLDCVDQPVPDELVEVFESNDTFAELARDVSALTNAVRTLAARPGGEALNDRLSEVEGYLRNARKWIEWCAPYAVAPTDRKLSPKIRKRGWCVEDEWSALNRGV